LRVAVAAAPPGLELGSILSVSPTLVAFSIALTLCTGLLTGLWPALRGSRADVQNDLKESGNSLVGGRGQERALNGLVIGEIALAMVLLTFAGLLVRSLVGLLHVDLGYRTDHVLTVRLPLNSPKYRKDEALVQFCERLLPQLAALPGVTSVAAASGIPMGGTFGGNEAEVEGEPENRDWADASTRIGTVTPGYFQTMGIALHAGRDFNASDTTGSEPMMIVNEAFVRKMMAGQNPIGKRVRIGRRKWQRIVGVVADSRYLGPTKPVPPEAYSAYAQDPWMEFVVLRTVVPEASVLSGVRSVVRGIDRDLAITQVRTMRESVDQSTSLEREMTALVGGFSAVTLGMAALGLGGVMAYTVSRRKRDIGLRMALGARGSDVWRDVITKAARLVIAGTVIGVAGAFAAARVVESLLYGVRPHDPLVLAAAPVLLAVVALLACAMPAHQAASVDPMKALRQE
jgi:predicted permease